LEKLLEAEIQEKLLFIPKWKVTDEKWIERKFRFLEYLKAIDFVQQIANLSENVNHHPFISIDYKLVTLKLTSWHAKGLTELDFDLAIKYDDLYTKIKR